METLSLGVLVGYSILFFFAGLYLRSSEREKSLKKMVFAGMQLGPALGEQLKKGYIDKLKSTLVLAGISISPLFIILLAGCLGVFFVWITFRLLGAPIFAYPAFILGPLAIKGFIGKKLGNRKEIMSEQLEGFLISCSNLMNAGLSLYVAMSRAAKNASDPLKSEIIQIKRDVDVGVSIADAFINASRRIPVKEFEMVAMTVQIHTTIGGNMANTFEKIANVFKERRSMAKMINAYTKEGRMSSIVVAAMPVIMVAIFKKLDPHFLDIFFKTTYGTMILAVCVMSIIFGVWMVRDMSTPNLD